LTRASAGDALEVPPAPALERRGVFVVFDDPGLVSCCFASVRFFPMSSNHFALTVEAPAENALVQSPKKAWTLLLLVFLAVHFAALFSPSLLDDADTTHANAAQSMALSGDWVTLKIDGVRYLEKPPLPYWLVAIDYRIFGYNVFATHLPFTVSVLGLAILAWVWGRRAFGDRAAFYAALSILTSIGIFLFTRFFIPEALLTLLLGSALYAFLTALEDRKPARMYLAWTELALAMLTKGLIAPVFFLFTVIPYAIVTGDWRRWREFRLGTGALLFLAIAAPWHILAGLHNPDQGHPFGNIPGPGNVHGFFYFYFVNEHFLRFLGRRYPDDYNKLPALLYWTLHLVWLFPWSLYLPVVVRRAWKTRAQWMTNLRWSRFSVSRRSEKFRQRSIFLLCFYSVFVLVFFALSTNQEYYTYPAYFSMLLLTAGALASAEEEGGAKQWLEGAHVFFVILGVAVAVALGYGLWCSRKFPYVPDIGTLLAHRNVANYTLSMSHFFDLTGPSFAALRLPATIAVAGFLAGPIVAWQLRRKGRHFEATASVAFTSAIFLVAAHIALVRFDPVLSSRAMADTVNRIAGQPETLAAPGASGATLLLYGDPSEGSSMIFYTHRQALLVNGRVSSMIWGSYYPDAPHIFLDDRDLLALWGKGTRKFLFVPGDSRERVSHLLGKRAFLLQELSDKALYSDRPL
jgi:4-amino-4-deoxy-L-arabinose transferase-like glycosyltransferase